MTDTDMRAVEISEPGAPSVLREVRIPRPTLKPGQVLVRVAAAGVNRPDVAQRQGRYPVPADASPLPGLEVAGHVAETAGPGPFREGDAVVALTHGGGYAEFVAVEAGHCLHWPEGLPAEAAACIPEVAFTVEFNMMMRARLVPGETVLIHGGSSGIGSHAVQRARAHGARVVATVGSDEKVAFVRGLGADLVVNHRSDWMAEIVSALGPEPIDVVLDMVAGDYVARNLSLIARNGRYALIALLKGPEATVPMNHILRKAITLTGSTLRPQPTAVKAEIAGEVARNVLPLIAEGQIRPCVYRTFALSDAAGAHELMETGTHMGKIALLVAPPA